MAVSNALWLLRLHRHVPTKLLAERPGIRHFQGSKAHEVRALLQAARKCLPVRGSSDSERWPPLIGQSSCWLRRETVQSTHTGDKAISSHPGTVTYQRSGRPVIRSSKTRTTPAARIAKPAHSCQCCRETPNSKSPLRSDEQARVLCELWLWL